jgi:ABC-type transport system involved in multi-copper enzyme maturation permease subunit
VTASPVTPTPSAPITLDIASTPRVPFSRLVRVELRKSMDTRAGFWLMATIAIIVLLAEAIALIVTVVQDEPMSWGDFVGAAAFLASFLLPILGIMLVTSEWSQRTAMVTFVLEPRRPHIFAAKALTGVILTLGTAALALALGAVCNLIYAGFTGNGDWELGWRFLVGFLITLVLDMLGGFALATLLLNTPAAIVAYFAYRWVLPILLGIGAEFIDWLSDIVPWIEFQSAKEPVYDLTVNGEEWGHLLTAGFIWLVIPLAVGMWRVLRAEVK